MNNSILCRVESFIEGLLYQKKNCYDRQMILKNFIVFEGLDGTGTTSQLRLLQEAYAGRGLQERVYFTYEPTDSPIGRMIRSALSDASLFHAQTVAYLFGADRCEHIYGKNGIIEHLDAQQAVFCDRYLFSSLAYQGLTAGEPCAQAVNGLFPLPEYLFFFDLPAETAMQRIAQRNMPREIYEQEPFQQRVAQAYEYVLRQYERTVPEMRIIRIDAAEPIRKIHENIWSTVRNLPI